MASCIIATISPPAPFKAGAVPAESWRNWKQAFIDYFYLTRLGVHQESMKLALFRHICGEELKVIYGAMYNTMEARPKKLQSTLEDLDVYFLKYKEETDYTVLYRPFMAW